MSDNCLFCRIVRGDIPATIVAESPNGMAIRDIAPEAPVHCLVLPRTHVDSLDAARADAALLGELMALAATVARQEGIAESGYRVVANTNADGGQAVYHLHLHVMGGRKMKWPPG